jgi:hypothetical protein
VNFSRRSTGFIAGKHGGTGSFGFLSKAEVVYESWIFACRFLLCMSGFGDMDNN